ncbi:MAG: hypothetical protein R3A12_18075 [Ignavibacteria bacterium]
MSYLKSRDQDDIKNEHNKGHIIKDDRFEPLVMFTFAFIQTFLYSY